MGKKKQTRKCVLCGEEVVDATIHDFMLDYTRRELDWDLCPNDLIRWVGRRLTPVEVKKLRKLAGGDTFHTNSDFYDEDGNTLQPRF